MREVQYAEKPTARMVGLRFEDVKLDYATLLFDVEVDNPYRVSLPLLSLHYSLTSGGRPFLTATALGETTVPPNTKTVLSLPDEVIYARLLRALNGEPGWPSRPCQISFSLQPSIRGCTPAVGKIIAW